MKGTILAIPTATTAGLISGDDDRRHPFSLKEWRGERPATAGMRVDFEPGDAGALAIFPDVSPVGQLRARAAKVVASPVGQHIVALFTRGLEAPLAALILLAGLLAVVEVEPNIPQLEQSYRFSLYAIGSEFGPQLDRMARAHNPFAERASAEDLAMLANSLLARWLAPLCAVLLLATQWWGYQRRWLTFATAAAAAVAVLNIFGVASTIEKAFPGNMDVHLGLGAWVLLACAVGLVLVALGKLANPLAGRSTAATR